ncbi:MAG: LPS assembly lipoprotein LptE [Hyphomicrobiaceae bacterium]
MSSAKGVQVRVLPNRRTIVRGLVMAALTAPALAACGNDGFKPLYGPSASGAPVMARMREVDIAPIPGRVGQQIRNELIFETTGGGEKTPPHHRLEVTIRESILSTLVNSQGEAAGQIYAVEAAFRLVNIADKKVVFQGTANARASFERYESIYSNVRAREDAENRAARTIADDMKTRLAAYLSRAA